MEEETYNAMFNQALEVGHAEIECSGGILAVMEKYGDSPGIDIMLAHFLDKFGHIPEVAHEVLWLSMHRDPISGI